MTLREQLIAAARSYLGTPFHHMARNPPVGVDCAGLVICAAREVGLLPPGFDVPSYSRVPDGVSLLAWCREHLDEVAKETMQAGDVIVVSMGEYPQHIGLLGSYRYGGFSIIHASAYSYPPRVIETRLMYSSAFKFSAVYKFRGLS